MSDDGHGVSRAISPEHLRPRTPNPHRRDRTWIVTAFEQGTERLVGTYEVSLPDWNDPRQPWSTAHQMLVGKLSRTLPWPSGLKVRLTIEEKS